MAIESKEQDHQEEEGRFDYLIKELIDKLNSTFKIIEKSPDFFRYQVSNKETLILSTNPLAGEANYRFTLKYEIDAPASINPI